MSIFRKKNPHDHNSSSQQPFFKVLIVDDEPDIHTMTRIVMRDFTMDGYRLEFYSAYSYNEAIMLCQQHRDAALMLLDVVMESDDAGLRVARTVREELKNNFVRIILRTGQPGQAPEEQVIVNYDINGYREKTLLDKKAMFSMTYTALRSYRDIMKVEEARLLSERNRRGIEKVLQATTRLFEPRSLKQFASGLLAQMSSLLNLSEDSLLFQAPSGTFKRECPGQIKILAASGKFEQLNDLEIIHHLSDEALALLSRACLEHHSIYENNQYVAYFHNKNSDTNLFYISQCHRLNELDNNLLEIFSNNVNIAFENLLLEREIVNTQLELISTLGNVVEQRSEDTGYHVERVSQLSRLLAEALGMAPEECDLIYMAAPLHDIGKIAIPDAILNKPGKLTAEEWCIMQTHAELGGVILSNSQRPIFRAAAIIASQHHERYDGKGYPQGLQGEAIHIYGRIVALADVTDALMHKRCYKEAWPLEKVLSYIGEQSGSHFDPQLVDLLMAHQEDLIRLNERLTTPPSASSMQSALQIAPSP